MRDVAPGKTGTAMITGANAVTARAWLDRIRALPLRRTVRVINVCGGHERTISMAGLRAALPSNIELIAGPGCPVCVCPEAAIRQAMQVARESWAVLVTFGDMLRVPVNAPKGEPRSLDQARAAGADIRPVASPMEAVRIAQAEAGRPVVFFAAGFETTIAPVAAMLAQGVPDNLSVLLAGRLTWPAVAMLLESGEAGFDALVAPGHVATVMGPEQWRFVVERHAIPAAIGGFSVESFLAGLYSVLRQVTEGRRFLDNCYPGVVRDGGNPSARRMIETVMSVEDAHWRGIGSIRGSGFALQQDFLRYDALARFPALRATGNSQRGEMPPGCDCARVVLGRIRPDECRLFGSACTPRTPVGPCMVSDEGACRIWWQAGARATTRPEAGQPETVLSSPGSR